MTAPTTTSTRTEKVRQAKQTLDEHLQVLAEQMRQGKSENLIRYLEFSSRFHTYSFGNMMLAMFQREGITRIAGLRQWNRLGRTVKPGEKGIMIIAPMTVGKKRLDEEDPNEEGVSSEEVTIFKPVYVFDVSQTEGAELPSLIHASGNVTSLLPAVREAICQRGIVLEDVESIPLLPGALGASYGGRIAVLCDLPEADAFRTLAHEFAHEILHAPAKDRPKDRSREAKTLRETEADAAAFVVCRHFGIDCDTADYLLLYDSDARTLLGRLETIRQTAAEMIDVIADRL